jgi:hypothetical protein
MPCLFPSQVEEKKGGAFFTFLVFNQVTSRHSGSYTCVASNSAASVNYTAQLLVKGQYPNLVQREKCDTELTVNFRYVTNQRMHIGKIYSILYYITIHRQVSVASATIFRMPHKNTSNIQHILILSLLYNIPQLF